MGQLRNAEVCMAPSVALDRFESSTMGGLAEQAILRDYLIECSRTPPDPFQEPKATLEEWWDTGNKHNYIAILLLRHKDIIEKRLRSIQPLRIPDISTWGGRYQRNKAVDPAFPDERNELYEIKPDSAWGILEGIKKTKEIEDSHRLLGLRGYKFGSWYPSPPGSRVVATKPVYFYHLQYVAESFAFRLRRIERSIHNLGATLHIKGVGLDIERRTSGLIYYKLCVTMSLDFAGEVAIAKRVVRRLYQALTASSKEERKKWELEVAASYAPMDANGKPVPEPAPDVMAQRVLKALDLEEQFLVEKIELIDELHSSLSALGQTLFSKLRGLPGDRFAVCCDETYMENEIKLPQRVRLQRLLQNLQVRPPLIFQSRLALAGAINRPLTYLLAAIYVIHETAGDPSELFHSAENFRAARSWLERNPAQSLIIGSVVVYGTALVAAGTLVTGGALFGAAGAAVGVAAPAALATPAGAAVGSDIGFGLARELAGDVLFDAALPAVEEALPAAAENAGLRSFSEMGRRLAAEELKKLWIEQLEAAARNQLEKAVAKAALKATKQDVLAKAIAVGGTTLAAAALRFATAGAPSNTPGAAPAGEPIIVTAEVGCIHLLKIYEQADITKLPPLYARCNYAGFSPEQPGGLQFNPDPVQLQKIFHLGVIRCL